MNLKLITPPATFPITVDEAKAHLRILGTDDDATITSLIEVATEQAEEITSRQLVEATWELYVDGLSESIELAKSPVQAVEKVEYIAEGSESFSLLEPSFYDVDILSEPGNIYRKLNVSYPSVSAVKNSVKITLRSGYEKVPAPIKQWMLLRLSTLYENRDEIVVGATPYLIESDYNHYLISKYKVGRL